MELAATSLSPEERRVVEGLTVELEAAYGPRLRALWLYGSAARGEQRREFSDVDLLVVLDAATPADANDVHDRTWSYAETQGALPPVYSVRVRDLAWLAERRAIRSFFVQEIDRDRVVLAGSAL